MGEYEGYEKFVNIIKWPYFGAMVLIKWCQVIATFKVSKSQVYKQLLRLEAEGLLVAQQKGNVRLFKFNPRVPYLDELRALLKKVLSLQSRSDIEKDYRERQRPRRTGKML